MKDSHEGTKIRRGEKAQPLRDFVPSCETPTLTPKLRFPEFRTGPGWTTEELMQQIFPREGEPLPRLRFPRVPTGALENVALARWLRGRTTVLLTRVSERLKMGHYTRASKAISRMNRKPARKLSQGAGEIQWKL